MRQLPLDSLVSEKKLTEITDWFKYYFVESTRDKYASDSTIVVFQGPTGSGKTSVLQHIVRTINVEIREFCDTTDINGIGVAHSTGDRTGNSSYSVDKKKSLVFEQFVNTSAFYNTIHLDFAPPVADSEFEDSPAPKSQPTKSQQSKSQPAKRVDGVVIHVEGKPSFARTHRVFVECLCRLVKLKRELSRMTPRRFVVVFECLESNSACMSLSSKQKEVLKIKEFKFNPITNANMQKLAAEILKDYNKCIDKQHLDVLVSDCSGDMRACIKTIELICGSSRSKPSKLNGITPISNLPSGNHDRLSQRASKKLKTGHPQRDEVSDLVRSATRSFILFHVMGKIFYQKRYYPVEDTPTKSNNKVRTKRKPMSQTNRTNGVTPLTFKAPLPVERPPPGEPQLENSTDSIVDMLGVEPDKLIAWLHQHYSHFCLNDNVARAAAFMDYMSQVDSLAMESMQSTQFYESNNAINEVQTHLAVEAATVSLYKRNDESSKKNKRVKIGGQSFELRNSVEIRKDDTKTGFYSFYKPFVLGLDRLRDQHARLASLIERKLSGQQLTRRPLEVEVLLVDCASYLLSLLRRLPKPDTKQPPNPRGVLAELLKTSVELDAQVDWSKMDAIEEKLARLVEKFEEPKLEVRDVTEWQGKLAEQDD